MSNGNGNEIGALQRQLELARAEIESLKERLAETNVTITTTDDGQGRVVFFPGEKPPDSDRLAMLLEKTMVHWLQQHPHLLVRTALGIVSQGTTKRIHVWYDNVGSEF